MLKNLYIRNFAIIDELELELNAGMTALTGETGAGKSILLGALNLVLGDRADNDSIKNDCEFAEVVAEFDITSLDNVSIWLVSQELNSENECILRRRIARDGRSRAYINSTPVNLQVIRELAEMLIDIHGQHEHQSIMKSAVQRQLLDDCANHAQLLEKVSNLYVELKLVEEQLQHLQTSSNEKSDRLDLLRFQTSELDTLALEANEYQKLNEQHKRLANAEKILTTVEQAVQLLSEDEHKNVQSSVSHIISSLGDITDVDKTMATVSEMLTEALVQIDESVSLLKNYGDNIDLDPTHLDEVEQRLQNILDLARKHRVEPDALQDLHQQLHKELNDIDHADERLEELTAEQYRLEEKYLQACKKLSASRKKAASVLDKSITQSMQTLGMSGGQFKIELSPAENKRSAYGLDKIEFTVTANAGQKCKPIARVASGGELARISLAIQMIIANNSKIPSLIFDEVDSGIGGGIAEIVGQHLRTLASIHSGSTSDTTADAQDDRTNQVICITHLPQVASQAHHHLRIEKHTKNKQTSSQVIVLDDEQRRQEIARMLSGVEITDQSLKHADEMIERAQSI
jgi:DNA repair protein RecN (Recombination protein N)